jgi:outer membrane protein TolC
MVKLSSPEMMNSLKHNRQVAMNNLQSAKANQHFFYCVLLIAYFQFSISFISLAQVISLDSILNRIENSNPMLKMYDQQILAVDQYAEMANSWMPPTLSTGPWQAPYNSFSDGMWMISAEQMIPNPAKQKANYKYMKSMASVEQLNQQARKNEMFTMAKQLYYDWIVLKKKIDVLAQTDSLLNDMVHLAELRYSYNKEKLNTIYKAKADLFELRNMTTMINGDIRMKNVELNTLMNLDKNLIFDVDTFIQDKNYDILLIDPETIASSRSDVKQFDASYNLIRLQQEYEKSKRLPEFGISLTHMQALSDFPNQFSAMGMISIPIVPWASKEYKSKIKGLENEASAIRYLQQSLINESTGAIVSIQIQLKSAKQQLSDYNINIIPNYLKSYQSAMIAYEQNTEDLFVVLDGLKMYRMALVTKFDLLKTILKLQIDYEREMEIR